MEMEKSEKVLLLLNIIELVTTVLNLSSFNNPPKLKFFIKSRKNVWSYPNVSLCKYI